MVCVCAGLLLQCVNYMAAHRLKGKSLTGGGAGSGEGREERVKSKLDPKLESDREEDSPFWGAVRDGLTSPNWSKRFRTSSLI